MTSDQFAHHSQITFVFEMKVVVVTLNNHIHILFVELSSLIQMLIDQNHCPSPHNQISSTFTCKLTSNQLIIT